MEGKTSTQDYPHSGRPLTLTEDYQVAKFNALVRSNCRLTIHEMAEKCLYGVNLGRFRRF